MMDEAMPSGNGVAACALNRLGHLLGEMRYLQAAEGTLKAAMKNIGEYPTGYGSLLNAMDEWAAPPQTIVLRGPESDSDGWKKIAFNRYAPHRYCLAIPSEEANLPGLLDERKPAASVVAYLCDATSCLPPILTLEEFSQALG